MSEVDLHLHSSASDGRLSPEALETARAFPGMTFIPGVEISTDVPEGEVHVLGYFIDFTDSALGRSLERFRNSRQGRAQGMINKLAGLGVNIDWARVQELAGDGAVGRPHIARAMLEKGYISKFEDAFEKYIGRGGPAYVERYKMTPAEAVALVRRARGLPVLAHPFTAPEPEKLLKALKPEGLVGLEAYYKDASRKDTDAMLALAAKYGLIATGGSDYHGIGESNEVKPGGVDVPLRAAEDLIALARERGIDKFSMSP